VATTKMTTKMMTSQGMLAKRMRIKAQACSRSLRQARVILRHSLRQSRMIPPHSIGGRRKNVYGRPVRRELPLLPTPAAFA